MTALFNNIMKQNSLLLKDPKDNRRGRFQHQKLSKLAIAKLISKEFRKSRHIVVLYLDLVNFTEIEQTSGVHLSRKILDLFQKTLEAEMPRLLLNLKIIAIDNLWGDDYIVVFSADLKPSVSILQGLVTACRIAVTNSFNKEVIRFTGKPLEVHVGYALLMNDNQDIEIGLYKSVKEAQEVAKGTIDLQTAHLLSEFRTIIDSEAINMHFQPIVSLKSGSVHGWEALARGPEASNFKSPGVLFPFAEEVDMLFQLEKLCRRKAVQQLDCLATDQKLFLNIHPRAIRDPLFVQGETLKIIGDEGLQPKNIVFEITERHSVDDYYLINKVMDHYRSQGYLVAVDDAGSGFSSLQSIAELRPDYIKMDMSIVRDIHVNSIKRTLMETMVAFAEKIGSTIIAEGIEEENELNTLLSLGVHYGQGYLIGRPALPKQLPKEKTSRLILKHSSIKSNRVIKNLFVIRDIAENIITVNKDIKVKDIQKILDTNDQLPGIVVLDNGKPIGLAMRNRLFNYLGSQYGVALYYDKSITGIMDSDPLIVDDNCSIENVAQLAMNRKKTKIYDFIIIVNQEGLFYGVVSIQNLLETMTRIHIDNARGANPLTGLPGSVSIEEEIKRRTNDSKAYSIIYLDIDHFKSYNDYYGFERGNSVLLFTSELLKKVVMKYGCESDFVGHVGGDDFIFITDSEKSVELCKKTIRYFDRLIKRYYNPEDLEKGGIPGRDRECKDYWYPIMTISLAVVNSCGNKQIDIRKISEKAAQLKCYAKTKLGSVYVQDRRSDEQTLN